METNSITKNRGGNNGSEKWIEKNTAAVYFFSEMRKGHESQK